MTNNTFRTKNGIEVLGNSRIYGSAIFGGPREFQFDPASLFANGEVGHWAAGYDPAAGQLYQVSNGTSPATAAGQPVGLALDTSKGTSPGPESVTNGGFDVDANWAKGAGWSIGAGAAAKVAGTASNLSQSVTLVSGRAYQVRYQVAWIAGIVTPQFAGGTTVNGISRAESGTFTEIIIAVSGNDTFRINGGGTFEGAIDNVSVPELPGRPALQATSMSRPTLSRAPKGGVRNLQLFSNQLTQHSLVRATPSENQILSPDGTVNGGRLTETATSADHRIDYQPSAFTSGETYVFSVFLRPDQRTWARVVLPGDVFGTVSANFNLSTGAVGITTGSPATSVQNVGGGWLRCSVSAVAGATASGVTAIQMGVGNNSISYAGDGTSGLFVYGAQLEKGTTATPYQRVVSARDVTEAGVPDVWHLNDDGNDSLPAALPAGNYTAAWVNALGAVTIAENVAVMTTLDTLRGQNQADVLIINRALGEAERVALTRYWQARYASI
jgi:hypothetical protein